MPTRDSTADDMLAGFNFKAIVDSKQTEARKVNDDAQEKRTAAESIYQVSVRAADDARGKAVEAAMVKRDRVLKAQDKRTQDALQLVQDSQQGLNDFQDKLEEETGVRVPLTEVAASAPKSARV